MAYNAENRYDFAIQKGDDVIQPFRQMADGNPVDMTGVIAVFECAIPSLTHTMTIDTPRSLGTFNAVFAREDTVNLIEHKVGYEVVFWHGGYSGTKETVFFGSLTLIPEKVL